MRITLRAARLLVCLTMAIVLGAACACPAAKAAQQEIEVSFRAMFSPSDIVWSYPYDDALFLADADAYSHTLARASLGLAFASARGKGEVRDASIAAYMNQAGFHSLKSEDYNRETGRDTIATMIGHKTLENGETLIAVGVSGFGYNNEWLSNLDIGNEQEHRGFSEAAAKVAARIVEYKQEYGLDARCRLWISGYSRAAAVANLTAASLMAQGVFDEKTAYVYTFATPRATRNPVAYANIFNIIGKFDPATKLPYYEWGYGRHGVDLYTPAQETDSDYRQKLVGFNEVYKKLGAGEYQNNLQVNHNYAVIAEYLVTIIPDTQYYDDHMHTHMVDVWNNPDLSTLRSLVDALSTPVEVSDLEDMERKQQIEDLTEYLSGIIYGIAAQSMFDRELDFGEAASVLLLEHQPEVYISWLFSSDDPSQIYSDKMDYVHLILDGDADVTLFDQKGGFVLSVEPDGTCSQETTVERYQRRLRPIEERPLIAVSAGEQRMMVLSKDQGMPFVIGARSSDAFSYYGINFNVNQCKPSVTGVRIINMEEGEHYLAFSFTPDGMERMVADDSIWGDTDVTASIVSDGELLSVIVTAELEGYGEVSVDVKTVVITIIVVLLVVLLILLLIAILLIRLMVKIIRAIIRSVRRKRQAH